MIEISRLKRNDETEWDEYIFNNPSSTFFHQVGWKNVVESSYAYKPYYLLAKDEGEIKGILPLFLIENLLLGRKLVSLPFAPYGGAIGENNAIEILIMEAIEITKEQGADYLELRNAENSSILLRNSLYATSILELDQNPEIIWNEKLTRNKRKNVVKSQKRGLSFNFSNEINDFYDIFAINMHDLGSPIHSKKFFQNILNIFRNSAKIQIVSLDNKPIYAAFYLLYKDIIINSWSSSLKEYRNYYPTDFGIWKAIEYACNNQYKYYDFGRSTQNSPNMEFKERWGAETKKLEYEYYINNVSKIPDNTYENPKRQIFEKVWKRLPLSITRSLGPVLRKKIP